MKNSSPKGKSKLTSVVLEKKSLSPPPKKSKRPESFWNRYWRYIYLRFFKLRGKPAAIARGWAVGVFSGFFPFFGFQMMIAIVLATLFHGHKLAAITGTWISNPITYVPIFLFNFKIGKLVLGLHDLSISDINFQSFEEIMEMGYTITGALLLGCFIMGIVGGFIAYFLSLWLMTRFQRK